MTDPEATCLAGRLDPATLGSLPTPSPTARRRPTRPPPTSSEALAVCQPKSYVDSQVAVITQGAPAATQAQAQCVVRNANDAFATDADLLALASGDESTQDWPAPQRAKLRAAIAPCAPPRSSTRSSRRFDGGLVVRFASSSRRVRLVAGASLGARR